MADYNVVLLVEHALTATDAAAVHSLHEEIADPVRYFVLLPVEDSAARIETGLGTLSTGEVMTTPALLMDPDDMQRIRKELLEDCRSAVAQTVTALQASGAVASGESVSVDPISALAAKVAEVDAGEAIILTRSHVVTEFFHLDWTSRARRNLGVPVLHLLEQENFDEQSGGGEGISGV